MDHELLSDMTTCIVVAWLLALGAQVFRQPLIVAYLAAGFLIGPMGLAWVKEAEAIQTVGSMGLLFLMFMIGLEIDLKKILQSGRTIMVVGLIQILGGVALGWAWFKWQPFGIPSEGLTPLYLAVAAALSSTVIIVKILYDKRELDTLSGRVTLGVLVMQDLFAILFLAIQPDLSDPSALALGASVFKAVVLVAIAFWVSRDVLPTVFRAVARSPELVLTGAIAWCFALSGIAEWLGLSREMGALVAGVAISTFPYTLDVAAKVTSLRDFFVTLFFVTLGMALPMPSWEGIGYAFLFAAWVVLSRGLTVFLPLYRMRQGLRASLVPAVNLSQISEFSIVILALGLKDQHLTESANGLVALAFVLLAVDSSYTIAKSEVLVRRVSPWLERLGVQDLSATGPADATTVGDSERGADIFVLGCFSTASSFLEDVRRTRPEWLQRMCVIDFNPEVIARLRRDGVHCVYGDISSRDTLVHARLPEASTILCTLPDSILRGISNTKLLRQLREIAPNARILMTAETLQEAAVLYSAGADFVQLPRLLLSADLIALWHAIDNDLLDQRKAEQASWLQGRDEILR